MDHYAVIGQPIAHSQSPAIHTRFAEQLKANLRYEAIEVAPATLAESLKRLHANGYQGLNVTLPHKVAVMSLCESVTERAQLAGAVNTLIRTQTGWRGDNTDGEGLMQDLAAQGIAVAGKRVLILGAGGAVRGILKPLLDARPAELTLSNRNPWKPEELAEQFKPHGTIRPCTHYALKGDAYDVVLHATSIGHTGKMLLLAPGLLAPGAACYDLSYGKAYEPFRAWAQSQGAAKVVDGLGMLVEQAASAFALWRGTRPQTAPVLAALR